MHSLSELQAMINKKPAALVSQFPCPYCKGQGSFHEDYIDYHEIRNPCYACGHTGFIIVGSLEHREMALHSCYDFIANKAEKLSPISEQQQDELWKGLSKLLCELFAVPLNDEPPHDIQSEIDAANSPPNP